MKQKESYHGLELPAPLGNMVTMVPPPHSCPKSCQNMTNSWETFAKKYRRTARITSEKAQVFTENNYLFAANMPVSGLDNNSQ